MTFVAYSGWLPRQRGAHQHQELGSASGSRRTTKRHVPCRPHSWNRNASLFSLEEMKKQLQLLDPKTGASSNPSPGSEGEDRKQLNCSMPPPFTPGDRNASPFSLEEMQKQLQLFDSKSSGATGSHSLDAPADHGSLPGEGSPGKRSEAQPRRPSTGAVTREERDQASSVLETFAALAAPTMFLHGAALGLRNHRKVRAQQNLGVSFTSAGGVKSVVFKLGYDAERVDVIGVEPGADLPGTARVSLSRAPNDGGGHGPCYSCVG